MVQNLSRQTSAQGAKVQQESTTATKGIGVNNNKQLPAIHQNQDVYSRFDSLDDEQIVYEITGKMHNEAAKAMYYIEAGKTCISKRGVDECCIKMQDYGYVIREEDITYQVCPVDNEYVVFNAKVSCYKKSNGEEHKLNTVIGTKRQWLNQKTSGGFRPDTHWFAKGSQKALRNARIKLIPEHIKAAFLASAVNNERNTRPPQRQSPPPPPPTMEQRLDSKMGFQKTGNLTWRQAAQNLIRLQDGGQSRQYLHLLSKWEKTPKAQRELAKYALDNIPNMLKGEVDE